MELGVGGPILYAHAILIVRGRYVLQLRDAGARECPGTWGMFGGSIDAGESPLEAVRRELMEELEIELRGPRHVADIGPCSFWAEDVSDRWARHVVHEGERAGLFTYEEVAGLERSEIVDRALAAHRQLILTDA